MVIIYSGGLDSTTALYQFKDEIKLAVTFNYGSKHNEREFKAAQYHTSKLDIKHIKIDLPFINEYFKSDLLQSGNEVPDGHFESNIMKKTIVPYRNGIMLSIAAGLAESVGAKQIIISNHKGDWAVWPDCRPEFIKAINSAISKGTEKNITLLTPYLNSTKMDIVNIGHELDIDFSETYSCYKGGEIHCGQCGTCYERQVALFGNDKTVYLNPLDKETLKKEYEIMRGTE